MKAKRLTFGVCPKWSDLSNRSITFICLFASFQCLQGNEEERKKKIYRKSPPLLIIHSRTGDTGNEMQAPPTHEGGETGHKKELEKPPRRRQQLGLWCDTQLFSGTIIQAPGLCLSAFGAFVAAFPSGILCGSFSTPENWYCFSGYVGSAEDCAQPNRMSCYSWADVPPNFVSLINLFTLSQSKQ